VLEKSLKPVKSTLFMEHLKKLKRATSAGRSFQTLTQRVQKKHEQMTYLK